MGPESAEQKHEGRCSEVKLDAQAISTRAPGSSPGDVCLGPSVVRA